MDGFKQKNQEGKRTQEAAGKTGAVASYLL